MVLWPLFGSLNQLMGALALAVITVYLASKKIPIIYTLLPMLFVLVVTLWAMIINLAGFLQNGEIMLSALSFLIIGLTGWLMVAGLRVLVRR